MTDAENRNIEGRSLLRRMSLNRIWTPYTYSVHSPEPCRSKAGYGPSCGQDCELLYASRKLIAEKESDGLVSAA